MPDLACGHYQNATRSHCGTTPARPYLTGPCCPAHTPAALAGKPEPAGGHCPPGRCWCGACPAWQPPAPVANLPRKRIQQEKGAA